MPEGGFYLGGGEVDLKLWVNTEDFRACYHPYVMDCTNPRDFSCVCSE